MNHISASASLRSVRRYSTLTLAGIAIAGCAPTPPSETTTDTASAFVQVAGLGSLSFPNSGSESAQDPFRRGVLLLHSFEFEAAAEAFVQAQEADPAFALAYWGEAMTYNHPLWRQKDVDKGREILARLGETAAERREKAGDEREAMYLDAIEALFAEGAKQQQDLAYMEAMARLSEAHPEDHEARAFHSLAILGSRDGRRDFGAYMKGAALAQAVFDANPDHPGAAHYLIHSFDDPVHAPLGLPAALAYAEIAPDAAHAQHMTTHIFVALGMWRDVVSGNIRARDTEDADLAARERRPNYCGHYSSWLHYGHLMLGEEAEAEALIDKCHGRMTDEPEGGDTGYFLAMRARHVLDTERWQLTERWQIEPPGGDDELLGYEFTNAFAALRQGDTEPAQGLLARHLEPESPYQALHLGELQGLVDIAAGRIDAGLETLRETAAAEEALPFAFGPPRVLKPTFELLAEELARQGEAAEAVSAYRRANDRNPGRPLAVEGLRRAQAAADS